MCVLFIKVPIQKMSGNLLNDPRMSTNPTCSIWEISDEFFLTLNYVEI